MKEHRLHLWAEKVCCSLIVDYRARHGPARSELPVLAVSTSTPANNTLDLLSEGIMGTEMLESTNFIR